jgi:hypothetical protein
MPITVEYGALAIGAVLVGAILIWDRLRMWKRARRIETALRKMEKKVYILEMQESGRLTRLVKELNGKSRAKSVSRDTAEMACGDVAVLRGLPRASPHIGEWPTPDQCDGRDCAPEADVSRSLRTQALHRTD